MFGAHLLFFLLQALVVSVEKYLIRRLGVPLPLQRSPMLCVALATLTLLPLTPLFLHPLQASGVAGEMETIAPRLVLV